MSFYVVVGRISFYVVLGRISFYVVLGRKRLKCMHFNLFLHQFSKFCYRQNFENWLPGQDSNLRRGGYDLTRITARVGLSLHPLGMAGVKSLHLGLFSPSSGLPSSLRYGFPDLARFSLQRCRRRLLPLILRALLWSRPQD